jgi:DNA replication protein DnaC
MAAITREAINLGYTAKYIRVSDMLTMLHEASTEKRLSAMTKTILKYELISLDELGYLTLNTRKSQLLFDIVAKRNEMGASIFVTSNFQFSQWTKFIGDTTLANALVGKLAGGSIVLNMNGEDYRLASLRGGD